MKYLVTVHTGFGSMVEASYPELVLGPYATEAEAEAVYNKVADSTVNDPHVDESFSREVWCNIIEIPDAPADVNEAVSEFLEEHL